MALARLRIAVAALALGAASALAAMPALAQDKVRFQTDWIPSGEHAMYYGGWQKGIFAAEGIDITITRGYGSGDTVTKLAGGGFDFGVADMAAVMTARARQGVPVKTIAVLYTQSPHSLFVLKSSGITSFKGLGGQEDRHHPGQQPQVLLPQGRRARRHRSQQDHLGQHGRRGHGGAADRQEPRRGALLLDPPLLPEQGGQGRRRGDHRAALRGGRVQDLRGHHHRQRQDRSPRSPTSPSASCARSRSPSSSRATTRRRPASCTSQKIPEVALDDCLGSVRAVDDLRLQRPHGESSAGARRARSGSSSPGRPSPKRRSSTRNGTTSRPSTPRWSRNEFPLPILFGRSGREAASPT